MKDKGRLIIIAAPSGAGKTTVIRRFLSSHPRMVHSVSCTTRPIRPGDVDGRDYHFIDQKTFDNWIKEDKFAEWAEVHGERYGTPKKPIEEWIKEGKDILLDVDVVGSLNLKKIYGDQAISVFLLPPSMEELKKRLAGRATDTSEQQALRLKNALIELSNKDKFDHRVVNDDLKRACDEIEEIINQKVDRKKTL